MEATSQSIIMNSKEMPVQLSQLEYSQSAFVETVKNKSIEESPQLIRSSRNEELTSLELLTAKKTNEDYRTPIKIEEKPVI